MHYIILVILVAALAYVTHTWVDARALAMVVGDKWVISGVGWSGMLPILLAGLIPGLVLGLFAGSGFGKLIEKWIDDGMHATRQGLAEDRANLQSAYANLDYQIKNATDQGRREGAVVAREASQARQIAEGRVSNMERKLNALQGRLRGAQQKAARMRKKAQLTRGDAPKPA